MKKPLFSTITDEDWRKAIEAARHRRSLMPYRIREAIKRADKVLLKSPDSETLSNDNAPENAQIPPL